MGRTPGSPGPPRCAACDAPSCKCYGFQRTELRESRCLIVRPTHRTYCTSAFGDSAWQRAIGRRAKARAGAKILRETRTGSKTMTDQSKITGGTGKFGKDSPAAKSGEFRIGGELPVWRLGFGAMRITGKGVWGEPPDQDEAIRVLRRAVELGINFIDTADSYGPHVSESLISEALHPYPAGLVIATKAGFDRSGPD